MTASAPPAIRRGQTLGIVAPAGPVNAERFARGIARLGDAFALRVAPSVTAPHDASVPSYLAAADDVRVDELNAMLRDPDVRGILLARGGYGLMRILPRLDAAALRADPKPIIGFSDLTSLLSAVSETSRIVCFHGPTARARLTDFSRASLLAAVSEGSDPCGPAPNARALRGGSGEGRLVGGNLALVAAMVGTRFAPDFEDSILFLEDVGERTYRVDRMLQQLYLSGALSGCRGIVFGEFTDCAESSASGTRELDEILSEIADLVDVPCIAGAPIGHIDDQWTLPVGARARLDADARTLNVLPITREQA